MKRLIYLFAALIALSSCTVSEGWNPGGNLIANKAYNLSIQEVRQQIHILSYAQTIDYYSRSGDGEREIIEDHHLPNTRLRQTDEGWEVVKSGVRIFTLLGNTPLNEVGSVWNVRVSNPFNAYDVPITTDQHWTIECTGENRWKLSQSAKYESHSVQLTFDIVSGEQIQGQLESQPICKYWITGECTIEQNEMIVAPYRIYMKTIEPIVFDNFKYYSNYTGTSFTEGKVSIRVTDYKTGEPVIAPFHYTVSPNHSDTNIEYLMTE